MVKPSYLSAVIFSAMLVDRMVYKIPHSYLSSCPEHHPVGASSALPVVAACQTDSRSHSAGAGPCSRPRMLNRCPVLRGSLPITHSRSTPFSTSARVFDADRTTARARAISTSPRAEVFSSRQRLVTFHRSRRTSERTHPKVRPGLQPFAPGKFCRTTNGCHARNGAEVPRYAFSVLCWRLAVASGSERVAVHEVHPGATLQ